MEHHADDQTDLQTSISHAEMRPRTVTIIRGTMRRQRKGVISGDVP